MAHFFQLVFETLQIEKLARERFGSHALTHEDLILPFEDVTR